MGLLGRLVGRSATSAAMITGEMTARGALGLAKDTAGAALTGVFAAGAVASLAIRHPWIATAAAGGVSGAIAGARSYATTPVGPASAPGRPYGSTDKSDIGATGDLVLSLHRRNR